MASKNGKETLRILDYLQEQVPTDEAAKKKKKARKKKKALDPDEEFVSPDEEFKMGQDPTSIHGAG